MKRTISVAILLGSLGFISAEYGLLEERPDIKECLDEVELKLKEVEIPEQAITAVKLLYERNPTFAGKDLFTVVYGFLDDQYELNGVADDQEDLSALPVCQKFLEKAKAITDSSKCGAGLSDYIVRIDLPTLAVDYPSWQSIIAHLTICPFTKQ